MLLSSITIRNYRNLVDIQIDFEPDFTVFIGENNAGKTNILDALYANLRVNRTVRQGAFEPSDYHLSSATAMNGDAGPIELTATFSERRKDEWPEPIVQALRNASVLDVEQELISISIRVSGTAPEPNKAEEYDWSFVDERGLPRAQRQFDVLTNVQRLRPFFRIDALRDVAREFNRRSAFFGPFVNDPSFPEALRTELADSLGDINDKVLGAHEAFTILRDSLDTGAHVLEEAVRKPARIEAVPSRLSDLLANTQVSYENANGAILPLAKHGSGTQSVAVLSLFKAYVDAKLANHLDPLSSPILAIEEPESHLHPSAIRSLWSLVESLKGQLLITTHSGELAGEVPLRCIRRLKSHAGQPTCHRAVPEEFSEDELRHINYVIRMTRGELFFSRCWILVEGRSEATALSELGRAVGIALHSRGVRFIEYAQHGPPAMFARLADQLGIEWRCLADGDDSGDAAVKGIRDYLAASGETEDGRITQLAAPNLEAYLCKSGFLEEIKAHIQPDLLGNLTAAPGTDAYFQQVSKLVRNRKTRIALEVAELVKVRPDRIPVELEHLLRA